ncbi:MAG: hypothetical protein LUG61_09435 [Lachnospiraceae bacterium]|nr:hypothetical protein [Lachnospiraceae bacterium]
MIDKQIAFNVSYGTSRLLRFLKAFEMYWHAAEGMKSSYSGTITLNGTVYRVLPERSFGYATQIKIWTDMGDRTRSFWTTFVRAVWG